MKIQSINNQNSFNGKVAILTNGLKKQEIVMLQKNERFLSAFAEKQPFDYIISRFKNNSLDIAILDRSKSQKLPKYKEKLSTEVLNYDSACKNENNNLNNIYDTMRFLATRWDYKIPYKELSFKEKFKYFFTHYNSNAYRIYRDNK